MGLGDIQLSLQYFFEYFSKFIEWKIVRNGLP